MGQRLNIEIFEDGKILANGYYHWRGYTSSAIILTRKILNGLKDVEQSGFDGVRKAIALLELTGAGLPEEEKCYYIHNIDDLSIPTDFQDFRGRNDGIISVSEEGIADTRKWAEASVEIDLVKQTIKFEALITMTREEFFFDYKGEKLVDFDWDTDFNKNR